MNTSSLQRFIQIHTAYADAIESHMRRLWNRELSSDEVNTIRSYTLCGSFMSLEAIDQGLSLVGSAERATVDFLFMRAEVNKCAGEVVLEVSRRLALGGHSPQASEFPNLLAWEAALIGGRSGLQSG